MLHYVTLFVCTVLISMSATGLVLKYLIKKAILDHPNERSSHSIPTPRGGGIGILIAVLPALLLIQLFANDPIGGYQPVLLSTFSLALLSWLDDLKDLGAAVRFATQIVAVSLCLYFIPASEQGFLGGFLPIWLEKVILGIGWVWFINLFNFMDGIDGISGVEILSIAAGIVLIASLGDLKTEYNQSALILAGGAAGFLKWNWHKAKVFMGDVGSVPLGFLLAWLLINLAGEGFLIASIIVALYYLMDATLTLIKRGLRKEKIWQAHREHYYQKATQAGMSHDQVVIRIAMVNLCLLGCVWLGFSYNIWAGLVLAVLSVAFCLRYFASLKLPNG
ncbi:glycosyltransferase family 4 protein [Terasakiella sp. A23]|uniref:MraY family glycosyltransferase n=1 Tax=Terasakiella sp. FCG-A23 TaxID=3080561 RepID=UPI0029553D9A|nr:glycosyltransferase family 4 protein [Terasakiella sp. A23]MDV7339800.1 glycosyltransferase family 4 protein [Terasakiella sp. A23]